MEIEERIENMIREQRGLVSELKRGIPAAGMLAPGDTINYMNQQLTPRMRNWKNQYEEIKVEVNEHRLKKLNEAHAELDFYFGQVIEMTDRLNPNYVIQAANCYRRAYQYDPKKGYLRAAEKAEQGVRQMIIHPWGLREDTR